MKWIKCTVMYGVPDEVAADWDEMSSFNFSAFPLHHPEQNQFVVGQQYELVPQEEAEQLMYSFFTEYGGI